MDCIKYGGEGMQLRSAPSPPMAVWKWTTRNEHDFEGGCL
jgi:hypothetical protein